MAIDKKYLARVVKYVMAKRVGLVVLTYTAIFLAFFSPVIFRGKFLAVGADGLNNFLPNFYSPKVLWDTMVFGGFPALADPEVMTWYPPAFLFSMLGSWNLFMIAAYIAAASFTFGYVHALTRSKLAGLFSGLVFGLSGFMIAHLGHAHVIHSAAWLPLIIWALENLLQKFSSKWFILGSVAVAFTFLGGQPQIFFYALILITAYLLTRGWNAQIGRWRYYLVSVSMVILGIGLSTIQILPTTELAGQGSRAGYSFVDYVSHSLPPRQSLTLIFPMLFGGSSGSNFVAYFGALNQTELTGYVGLLPLILAVLGFVVRRDSVSRFWFAVMVLASLLVIGDATPLARLVYHVPVLNAFRAPARHFFEFTFAVSTLSGLGLAAILQQKVSIGLIRKTLIIAATIILACLGLILLNSRHITALAAQQGIAGLRLAPWTNQAVAVPLLVFLAGITALWLWHRNPGSSATTVMLLLVLILDLASFGWFYEWRYSPVDQKQLHPPATDLRYRDSVVKSLQRVMPFRGSFGKPNAAPPNLCRLWGLPSAAGYNALIVSRTASLLGVSESSEMTGPLWRTGDSSLDIMAVRYFFLPPRAKTTDQSGIVWLNEDLQKWLGSNCDQAHASSVAFEPGQPFNCTSLAVVSRLACAINVTENTEVARVRFVADDGALVTESLKAGRDSSEWAYDCRGVKDYVRHSRAPLFKNYPVSMSGEPCDAHFYVTHVNLDRERTIRRIEIEWVNNPGALIIEKLTLINEKTGSSYPIDTEPIDRNAWRFVEESADARVYENLRALPRAWIASELVTLSPEEVLKTIKTSRLPDGREFDPRRTALAEDPLPAGNSSYDRNATAVVAAISDTSMEVHTTSAQSGILVTSDTFYPGWQVLVDGKPARLYRIDFALRGVPILAGDHVVRFDYRPRSFYIGAAVSALSLLVLLGSALSTRFLRSRN